jgi:cytidylate kinase
MMRTANITIPPAASSQSTAPVDVIAISGPDNVGKSTQLRILARRLGSGAVLAGKLDNFDPRWKAIQASGMAVWWFESASAEEFADVLACSYLERARQAAGPGLKLMDRGTPMLEASVAAAIAVREALSCDQAAGRARVLLASYEADIRRAEAGEYAIVLLHDIDPEAGTARSLARAPDLSPVYASYQRQLHAQMERLVRDGRFAATIVAGDLPIMAIQAQIRKLAAEAGAAMPSCRLPEVSVVAFGGLSESGKSTAAEYLRSHHGFARLKIGYLLEAASAICGVSDPQAADAVTQAELMADTLDRYCLAHHFLDRVSIESLHRYEPVTELRKLLGEALTVIYLDTDLQLRQQRGTAGAADVVVRDAIKRERGADAIVSIADEVIVNNRDRLSLCRRLDHLVYSSAWPKQQPAVAPVNTLGLPVHLEAYLAAVTDRLAGDLPLADLIAVTGSGARGKYQHGWSDLDILIIAPTPNLPLLRDVLNGHRADLEEVKLGVTLLTAAECAAAMVSPRVLHVLAQIGSGDIACLWCRPGLALPVPDRAADADGSVHDGVTTAIEIRRELLRPVPDPRSLYKLTGLLAKVMLRFEGDECPADDQALRVFSAQFPHAIIPAGLLAGARDDHESAALLAGVVLGVWLETIPDSVAVT